MIRRHSLSAVCMHWFNAFCWIALLFTGFALLSNPAMQPVGMWWADLWTGVFGAYGLLVFHLLNTSLRKGTTSWRNPKMM